MVDSVSLSKDSNKVKLNNIWNNEKKYLSDPQKTEKRSWAIYWYYPKGFSTTFNVCLKYLIPSPIKSVCFAFSSSDWKKVALKKKKSRKSRADQMSHKSENKKLRKENVVWVTQTLCGIFLTWHFLHLKLLTTTLKKDRLTTTTLKATIDMFWSTPCYW